MRNTLSSARLQSQAVYDLESSVKCKKQRIGYISVKE